MKDTIDVLHIQETGNYGRKFDHVVLVLNGKEVEGAFCPMTFIGSANFDHITIELMTCSCGVPGCAGIFEGTEIKRDPHKVEWRDIDCGFPKKRYSFGTEHYDTAVRKASDIMRTIAKSHEDYPDDHDKSDHDSLYVFHTVKEYEDALVRSVEWMQRYDVK